MKIKRITEQVRRDFSAIMECEFCGHEVTNHGGYDDRYYHDQVIPNMKCKKCKKSTIEHGKVEYRETRYPEGFQI